MTARNVPVNIVTGCLESGKTKFVSEMLADDGFSEGERTLLICCEEGEEEYDPKLLRKSNTVKVDLEEMEDMARFVELDETYMPERVFIEFNSTWEARKIFMRRRSLNAGAVRRLSAWWIPRRLTYT